MENAFKIIEALNNSGYEAFIVGGAVRDYLLGITSHDVDIVVLTEPENIEKAAKNSGWKVKKIGAEFGVIIVIVDGYPYEVTSARTEVYGEDSHRPQNVEYITDIKQDLARRDFTINAMAMDINKRIIDPFGGQQDLKNGIIRAVGKPLERFEEDGLRSFRAVRQAAQYGFEIEGRTLKAIPEVLHRVRGLSVERVRDEIEKILVSYHPATGLNLLMTTGLASTECCYRENGKEIQVRILSELEHLVDLEQNPKYHRLDVWEHTLAVVENTPANLVLRWAALLHDVGKGIEGVRKINKRGELADPGHDKEGAKIASEILSRLKVKKNVAERVCWIIKNHMKLPEPKKKRVLKWVRKQAKNFKSKENLEKAVNQLLAVCEADIKGKMTDQDFSDIYKLNRIVNSMLDEIPFYKSELNIDGRIIAEELEEGPQVGHFQEIILERIQKGELKNSKNEIYKALLKKKEKG